MTKYIDAQGNLQNTDLGCNTKISGILYQSYTYSSNDNLLAEAVLNSAPYIQGGSASLGSLNSQGTSVAPLGGSIGDSPFASSLFRYGIDDKGNIIEAPTPNIGAQMPCDADKYGAYPYFNYPGNSPGQCAIANREYACLMYPKFDSAYYQIPSIYPVAGFVSNSPCNGIYITPDAVSAIGNYPIFAGPCIIQTSIIKNTYSTTIEIKGEASPCYHHAKASDFCEQHCKDFLEGFTFGYYYFPSFPHVAKSPGIVINTQTCIQSDCGSSCTPIPVGGKGFYWVRNQQTAFGEYIPYTVSYSTLKTQEIGKSYSFEAPDCKGGSTICNNPCYGTQPFSFYDNTRFIQIGSNKCLCVPEKFVCDPAPGKTSCDDPSKVPRASVNVCGSDRASIITCKYEPSEDQAKCYNYDIIKLQKEVIYCGDGKNSCYDFYKTVEYDGVKITPNSAEYGFLQKVETTQKLFRSVSIDPEVPDDFTTPYLMGSPIYGFERYVFFIWHDIGVLQPPTETITLTVTVATCITTLSPCEIP